MSLLTANELNCQTNANNSVISRFYAKTTTGNSDTHIYAPTVTFARWRSVCEFATPAHGALRLQPTNRAVKLGRPVGRRYRLSAFQHSLNTPDYVETYSSLNARQKAAGVSHVNWTYYT